MEKTESGGWKRTASQLIFLLYLFALFYLLFFSENYGRTEITEEYRYNLELFREIKRFIRFHELLGMKMVLINLLGNVAAFIPFGFFLPVLWKDTAKLYRMFLLTLGFSLLIELVQLLYRVGTFDVDDLLLNTLGGLIGYAMWRISDIRRRRCMPGNKE